MAFAAHFPALPGKDPVTLLRFVGGGGVLTYHKPEAVYVHTLNSRSGLCRKAVAMRFAVDARDSFKEEIDAQIKQCKDEAAKLPAHARARVDALLAAEVLVGVKHHIFEGFHRKGIITSKDRDELGEGLMQLEHHLENCREFAQAEFRRAARARCHRGETAKTSGFAVSPRVWARRRRCARRYERPPRDRRARRAGERRRGVEDDGRTSARESGRRLLERRWTCGRR